MKKIVTALSSNYLPLWYLWRHYGAFGDAAIETLSLDAQANQVLQRDPQVACSFNGVSAARRSEIWQRRLDFILRSVHKEQSLIHSDLDAFWLRDPWKYLEAIDADFIFSKDRGIPKSAVNHWGFSLCCGFFMVRSGKNSLHFLDLWRRETKRCKDDQIALNRILLRKKVFWKKERHPEKGFFHSAIVDFEGRKLRFVALSLWLFNRSLPFCQRGAFIAHPWFRKDLRMAYVWLHQQIGNFCGRIDPWPPVLMASWELQEYAWLDDHDRSLFWALRELPKPLLAEPNGLILKAYLLEQMREFFLARTCYEQLLEHESLPAEWWWNVLRFAYRYKDRSLFRKTLGNGKWYRIIRGCCA